MLKLRYNLREWTMNPLLNLTQKLVIQKFNKMRYLQTLKWSLYRKATFLTLIFLINMPNINNIPIIHALKKRKRRIIINHWMIKDRLKKMLQISRRWKKIIRSRLLSKRKKIVNVRKINAILIIANAIRLGKPAP